jgi:hypothetical protein
MAQCSIRGARGFVLTGKPEIPGLINIPGTQADQL